MVISSTQAYIYAVLGSLLHHYNGSFNTICSFPILFKYPYLHIGQYRISVWYHWIKKKLLCTTNLVWMYYKLSLISVFHMIHIGLLVMKLATLVPPLKTTYCSWCLFTGRTFQCKILSICRLLLTPNITLFPRDQFFFSVL